MSKPTLYLFAGAPGSGKTTVAKLIETASGAVHIWSDHERQAMFDTVTHSAAESQQLYEYLNERTAQLLSEGKSVVFDTNFNYKKDRDYLRSIADSNGADTVLVWLRTPIVIARDRALHSDHRDRNRYQDVMTAKQFDQLVNRLEPPTDNENFITVDGSDIDTAAVKRQLGL